MPKTEFSRETLSPRVRWILRSGLMWRWSRKEKRSFTIGLRSGRNTARSSCSTLSSWIRPRRESSNGLETIGIFGSTRKGLTLLIFLLRSRLYLKEASSSSVPTAIAAARSSPQMIRLPCATPETRTVTCGRRDGALVAHALDLAGYGALTRHFYAFCARVITEEGYFLHKYNPDASLASSWHPWIEDGKPQLPIQEDETALVLWALWHHFDLYRDVEAIKPLYRSLIIRAGEFMTAYRDEKTGLPRPSYDLWEERLGVSTFTTAAVIAGLRAASMFAHVFGEDEPAHKYSSAAQQMKEGMLKILYSERHQRFARMVIPRADGGFDYDWTIDASLSAIFKFSILDPRDRRVASTMNALRERLWVKTDVGGAARYENDGYHQASRDIANIPGNPWIVCTLWLAEYHIAKAKGEEELTEALSLIAWVAKRALPSGVLAEQINPFTGEPLSVSPLAWSQAEFVIAVLQYRDKVGSLSVCSHCGSSLAGVKRGPLPQVRADPY